MRNTFLVDRLRSLYTDPAIVEAADQIERLQEILEAIEGWSHAFPLAVFPEPDLAKARELLQAGGMTLDAISASAMRHVITQVGKMARAGLELPNHCPVDRDGDGPAR